MKPETLTEARAWDARKEAYVAAGMPDRDAAAAAWGTPDAEEPDASENSKLLKTLFSDGDAKIAKDIGCFPCGACHKTTCFVCEYAKARKRVRGFSAKNYLKNSHRGIPELTLRRIKKLAEPPAKKKTVQCQNCERPFEAKRSTAKWCSPRCRVAGNAA